MNFGKAPTCLSIDPRASFVCCVQYNLPFYLQYLASWPEYCLTAEGPGNEVMGYILGKAEGDGEKWHGHVTAVTVAPEYRYKVDKRNIFSNGC